MIINANTANVPPIPWAAAVCKKISGWLWVVFPVVVTLAVVTSPGVVMTGLAVDDKFV